MSSTRTDEPSLKNPPRDGTILSTTCLQAAASRVIFSLWKCGVPSRKGCPRTALSSWYPLPLGCFFFDKNVVGSLEDPSPVISTLLSSFEYCRGFGDPLDVTDGPKNMAIFCSSSAITFRQPLANDFQGSGMRQRVLTEFPSHEILFTGGTILTDKHNYLSVDSALEHWHVIRTVLPAEIWINY